MANILITGGAGFIGSNFVRFWAHKHPSDRLIVLDSLTYAADPAACDEIEQAELVVGDIRNTELVAGLLADNAIHTLVHFAAETHVDRSIGGPDAFVDTNIVGTHSLLKAACETWLNKGSGTDHRFHHISTDEVFGSLNSDESAFHENSQFAPNSPYSASKAAADHLVRAYHQTFGLQVTTSNCSNNYGPYQHPEKLIPLFVVNTLLGRNLPIYGDGQNIRDWLHVEDHCRGIEACLAIGKAGEVYNFGGGAELTNEVLIDALCAEVDAAFERRIGLADCFPDAPAAMGKKSADLKRFVDDRLGHDRRYAIDDAKARQELSFAPQLRFDEGLRQVIDWYCDNENWWRPIVSARTGTG